MEIYFLGTGAGVPSKNRNVSSIALQLLQERGSTWLIDCGEATQHQILHTNIRPRRIDKIFITHLHGDHIFGLPGLLGSRSFQGGDTPLNLYGPKGIKAFIETALQISSTRLTYELLVHEIEEGIVFEDEHFIVYSHRLEHGIQSYGYRFQEKDKPGELLVDQLKAEGIMPGPIYQQIKENPSTTLQDGRVLHRKDYVGPNKLGRSISIFGDTRYLEHLASFIDGSDLFVHEATFSGQEADLAFNYYHSTTTQAAELAKKGNVKQLILTHISSRYQKEALEQLKQEAEAIFPKVLIAEDFFKFEIPNR